MEDATDQQALLADILLGLASNEMLQLLFQSDTDSEELMAAVLSSRLSLSDKAGRLSLISDLDTCTGECRSKIEHSVKEIQNALSKLGAYPGVVWFIRIQDGLHRPAYEQLVISPDMIKPWETFEGDYLDCELFDSEPQWTELWRMVPTESGIFRPDCVYYIDEVTPIFFGKPQIDAEFSFIDYGISFSHPDYSKAECYQEEYFCQQWAPTKSLPYEVGDIVDFDLAPFGPSGTACIIGNENGTVGIEDTKVLFMDHEAEGWRLTTLANLEEEYQGGNGTQFPRMRKPRTSVYCGLSASSASDFDSESRLLAVHDYFLELHGFADIRAWRSTCFQRDWDYSYGSDSVISDEQLDALLHTDNPEWPYDPSTPSML